MRDTGRVSFPIWPCTGRGLSCNMPSLAYTVVSCTAFSPSPLWGCMFSVTLSFQQVCPAASSFSTGLPAMWCPDFPPLAERSSVACRQVGNIVEKGDFSRRHAPDLAIASRRKMSCSRVEDDMLKQWGQLLCQIQSHDGMTIYFRVQEISAETIEISQDVFPFNQADIVLFGIFCMEFP